MDFKRAAACFLVLMLAVTFARSEEIQSKPAGFAWHLSGAWHLAGNSAPLADGDAVPAGSLVYPDSSSERQFINIFLPDGRNYFFECSTAQDCARGFRVPVLYRNPEPSAVDLLNHIRDGIRRGPNLFISSDVYAKLPLPRDEVVTTIDSEHKVQLGGLVAKLPDGRYSCNLYPLDPHYASQRHIAVVKTGPSVPLALPAPGLYELTFTDEQTEPRIRIFIAAFSPAQTDVVNSYQRVRRQFVQWNEEQRGWPIHEFGWAYAESFFLNTKSDESNKAAAAPANDDQKASARDVTAEPTFDPAPGSFASNQTVSLRCATPGARIHYTVGGAQPVAASPVYTAPINVKGSTLTIQAFASAPGKKDSPVVIGVFGIEAPK